MAEALPGRLLKEAAGRSPLVLARAGWVVTARHANPGSVGLPWGRQGELTARHTLEAGERGELNG